MPIYTGGGFPQWRLHGEGWLPYKQAGPDGITRRAGGPPGPFTRFP